MQKAAPLLQGAAFCVYRFSIVSNSYGFKANNHRIHWRLLDNQETISAS